jgi:hypothetical protein
VLKLVTTTVYNSETGPSQCWHTVAVRGCMERGWPGRVAYRWAFVVFSSLCWEVDFRQGIESESPFFFCLVFLRRSYFPPFLHSEHGSGMRVLLAASLLFCPV